MPLCLQAIAFGNESLCSNPVTMILQKRQRIALILLRENKADRVVGLGGKKQKRKGHVDNITLRQTSAQLRNSGAEKGGHRGPEDASERHRALWQGYEKNPL